MSLPSRQYDIARQRAFWLSVPGCRDATDYVSFVYDSTFPADEYRVVVESMSNASPHQKDRYRDIGQLSKHVKLPEVIFGQGFGSHSKILVLPKDDVEKPAYAAKLIRGSTYTIRNDAPIVTCQGHRGMVRAGSY